MRRSKGSSVWREWVREAGGYLLPCKYVLPCFLSVKKSKFRQLTIKCEKSGLYIIDFDYAKKALTVQDFLAFGAIKSCQSRFTLTVVHGVIPELL